jgi:hypothetical protein
MTEEKRDRGSIPQRDIHNNLPPRNGGDSVLNLFEVLMQQLYPLLLYIYSWNRCLLDSWMGSMMTSGPARLLGGKGRVMFGAVG